MKNASESPRLILHGLYILNFYQKNITRLRGFNLKRSRQVVDFCEVNIFDIFSAIVVLDLTAGPINTLNLDDLIILDGASKWN